MLSTFDTLVEYVSVTNKLKNAIQTNGPKLFSLGDVDPHLTHQCLGRLDSPVQMAARSFRALSHNYATKSPLVTMERSTSTRTKQ